MQPRITAISDLAPRNFRTRFRRSMRGGGAVMVWGGLNRGFESGESFFEGAGDSEQSQHSGFGDVAAVLSVFEQGGAQE